MVRFVLAVTSQLKVHVVQRVLAKLIDLALVIFVSAVILYPLGPLLAFAYSLTADCMNFGPFDGQSVGKKAMKLQVVDQRDRKPIGLRQSVLRNAPVGVATFFAIIPVWGWLILIVIGLPLMIMEVYLMATIVSGHRLGDVMGETDVVDFKPSRAAPWPA